MAKDLLDLRYSTLTIQTASLRLNLLDCTLIFYRIVYYGTLLIRKRINWYISDIELGT